MSIASKIFEIWAVNKTVSVTTSLFMRFLAGMAAVAVCAVVASIIIALLLVGSVWLSYTEMIAGGMNHQTAALIIGSLLLALLAAIMQMAKSHFYQLHSNSRNVLDFHSPLVRNTNNIIDAFLEGFESAHPMPLSKSTQGK